jgi:hypothetical protein
LPLPLCERPLSLALCAGCALEVRANQKKSFERITFQGMINKSFWSDCGFFLFTVYYSKSSERIFAVFLPVVITITPIKVLSGFCFFVLLHWSVWLVGLSVERK